jgi:GNAT superfamily N-acetyltransferase
LIVVTQQFAETHARIIELVDYLLQILLSEWLQWEPSGSRAESIRRAIGNEEFLVAEVGSELVGLIHYVMHEDVVDGAPNAFITAFYMSEPYRGRGIGTLLLADAVTDSLTRGAVGVETSTIHPRAKSFYEKRHFRRLSET